MLGDVVSNAGPLIALAKLNLLHLLKSLYGFVRVPSAVYTEAVVEGMQRGFADAYTLQLFMQQHRWEPVFDIEIPDDLQQTPLDRGEKEAIALAVAQNALLLLDEEQGRQQARQRGLAVRGTLGVLIAAYRRSLITTDQLRLYFRQIQERDDIWISSQLCQRLLQEALGALPDAQPEDSG